MRLQWFVVLRSCAVANVLSGELCGIYHSKFTYRSSQRKLTTDYFLRVPWEACSDGGRSVESIPLVVCLHGYTESKEKCETRYPMSATPLGTFALLAPDGYGSVRNKSWNAGECCGPAVDDNVDSVGLLLALIDHVTTHPAIQRDAIVLSGFSNGAFMVSELARARRFAAILMHSGHSYHDLDQLVAQPVMLHWSSDDTTVRMDGCCSDHTCCCGISERSPSCVSAETLFSAWLNTNSCSIGQTARTRVTYTHEGMGDDNRTSRDPYRVRCLTGRECGFNTTLCSYNRADHLRFDLAEWNTIEAGLTFAIREICELGGTFADWHCRCQSGHVGGYCLGVESGALTQAYSTSLPRVWASSSWWASLGLLCMVLAGVMAGVRFVLGPRLVRPSSSYRIVDA